MQPNKELIAITDFGWVETTLLIVTNTNTTIYYWVTTTPIDEMFKILKRKGKACGNSFINGNGGGYNVETGPLAGTHVFRYQQITDLKDHCKWSEFLTWWTTANIWKEPLAYEGEEELYEYFQNWLKDNYGFNALMVSPPSMATTTFLSRS